MRRRGIYLADALWHGGVMRRLNVFPLQTLIVNPGTDTINAAIALAAPGTLILVNPGTYTDAVTAYAAGTSAHPVVIRANGAGVIIDGSGMAAGTDAVTISADYVTVEGFEITNAPHVGIGTWNANHVTIQNNDIHDCQNAGIYTGGDVVTSHNRVLSNRVWHTCLSNSARTATSGWPSAISGELTDDLVASLNSTYENYGEGIGVAQCRRASITLNTSFDNYSVDIYLNDAQDATATGNLLGSTGYAEFYRSGLPANSVLVANENGTYPSSGITATGNTIYGTIAPLYDGSFGVGGGFIGDALTPNTVNGAFLEWPTIIAGPGRAPTLPAPVAAGSMADQSFMVSTGMQYADLLPDFQQGGGGTPSSYALVSPPAGVSISTNPTYPHHVAIDTDVAGVLTLSSIVYNGTNSAGTSANAGFSLTVDEITAYGAPTLGAIAEGEDITGAYTPGSYTSSTDGDLTSADVATFIVDGTPYDQATAAGLSVVAGQVISVTVQVTDSVGSAYFYTASQTVQAAVLPSPPDSFTSGQVTLTDSPSTAGNRLSINVLAVPADGGSPLTYLRWQLSTDGGSTWGSVQQAAWAGIGAYLTTTTALTSTMAQVWAANAPHDATTPLVVGPVAPTYRSPSFDVPSSLNSGSYTTGDTGTLNLGAASPNATLSVTTFTLDSGSGPVDYSSYLSGSGSTRTFSTTGWPDGTITAVVTATNPTSSVTSTAHASVSASGVAVGVSDGYAYATNVVGTTIDLVVTSGTHAGTYTGVDISAIAAGPILVAAAVITGATGSGSTKTRANGLWVGQLGDGPIIISNFWQLGATNTGNTSSTYLQDGTEPTFGLFDEESALNGAGSASHETVAVAQNSYTQPTVQATGIAYLRGTPSWGTPANHLIHAAGHFDGSGVQQYICEDNSTALQLSINTTGGIQILQQFTSGSFNKTVALGLTAGDSYQILVAIILGGTSAIVCRKNTGSVLSSTQAVGSGAITLSGDFWYLQNKLASKQFTSKAHAFEMWLNMGSIPDITDPIVQGDFWKSDNTCQDYALAATAYGSPLFNFTENAAGLTAGTNLGTGVAFTKTGAGSLADV